MIPSFASPFQLRRPHAPLADAHAALVFPPGERRHLSSQSAASCTLTNSRGRSAFHSQRPRNFSLLHVPASETLPGVTLTFAFGCPRRCQAALGLFNTRKPNHLRHLRPSAVRRPVEAN